MYQLETFGGLLLSNGARAQLLAHRRRLAFLTLVASAGARGISRDKVLAYLWPESSEGQARHNLEQLVYAVRRQLGESVFDGSNPISLNPTIISSDLQLFRQAHASGDWATAVGLYRGPFLDGFHLGGAPEFERWVEEERGDCARQYRSALEHLARGAETAGDAAAALGWWRLLVTADPYGTSYTLGLMGSLAASGNRAEALDRARIHESLIRTELETVPHPDLAALADRIRSGADLPLVGAVGAEGASPATIRQVESGPGQISTPDPLHHRNPSRARTGRRAAAVLFAAVVPSVLWLAHRISAGTESPAPDMMSVPTLLVPFRISTADSGQGYLSDGIVDLLIRRLQGEGGLPVLSQRDAPARTPGEPVDLRPLDKVSARRLASQIGAGQLLEGEIVKSGTSRLIISAALIPLTPGRDPVSVNAVGSQDSLPQLLDILAASLLARVSGEDDGRVQRLSRVSLSALKPYLAGRSAYRRGDYDGAVARLGRALAEDSTFALAALELADAAGQRFRLRPVTPALSTNGWPVERDSTWLTGIALARSRATSLEDADRRYLDLIAGARFPQGTPALEQLTAWEQASARWPERAEIWLHFGELLLYGGPAAAITDSRARAGAAFRRARQADPNLAGALTGLIEIAAFDRDTAAVKLLGSQFLARDSTSPMAAYVRWRMASVADTRSLDALRSTFDSLDSAVLGRIQWTSQMDGPAPADADRAVAILLRRASNFTERRLSCVESTHLNLNEGRPSAALQTIDDIRALDQQLYCSPLLWIYYNLYWDGDSTKAASVATGLRKDYTAWRAGGPRADLGDMLTLAQWDLWHGDTAVAVALLPRLNDPSEDSSFALSRGGLLAALLAAVRGSGDAIALTAKADSAARLGCCADAHWADPALARIWQRLGDMPRALQAARRAEWYFAPEYLSASLRIDARLSAALGDRAGAVRAYERLVALESSPEPAYGDRARLAGAELARLKRR